MSGKKTMNFLSESCARKNRRFWFCLFLWCGEGNGGSQRRTERKKLTATFPGLYSESDTENRPCGLCKPRTRESKKIGNFASQKRNGNI
jgi:hypothetical protein